MMSLKSFCVTPLILNCVFLARQIPPNVYSRGEHSYIDAFSDAQCGELVPGEGCDSYRRLGCFALFLPPPTSSNKFWLKRLTE